MSEQDSCAHSKNGRRARGAIGGLSHQGTQLGTEIAGHQFHHADAYEYIRRTPEQYRHIHAALLPMTRQIGPRGGANFDDIGRRTGCASTLLLVGREMSVAQIEVKPEVVMGADE